MDIFIACLLIIIAMSMFAGRHFKITIRHEHKIDDVVQNHTTNQKQLDESEITNMNGAIKALNEVMGVFTDAEE